MGENRTHVVRYLVQPNDSLKNETASSPLRLELFHYVQKVIVDLRMVAELQFHLIQVRQSIFHLRARKKRKRRSQRSYLFFLSHSLF